MGLTYATHAQIWALAQGLQITVEHKVGSVSNLQTGETQVVFTEEHTDSTGQPVKVPSAFIIAIPIFAGGDRYQIPVRLRYRKQNGSLVWWFEMYRADAAFDLAFRHACDTVQAATSLPLFYGSPEA